MKLTKSKLRQIIREELLNEESVNTAPYNVLMTHYINPFNMKKKKIAKSNSGKSSGVLNSGAEYVLVDFYKHSGDSCWFSIYSKEKIGNQHLYTTIAYDNVKEAKGDGWVF